MNFFRLLFSWFRSSIRGFDTPGQLALGFALGMVLGLIPKDSMLFYGLGVIAVLTTGNLLTLICGVLFFHSISNLLDPWTHELGLSLLTAESMQSTWQSLTELPFVAWTRISNTIVMGSVAIGLLMFPPVYLASYLFFRKFGTQMHAWFSGSNFSRWLIGTPPTITES